MVRYVRNGGTLCPIVMRVVILTVATIMASSCCISYISLQEVIHRYTVKELPLSHAWAVPPVVTQTSDDCRHIEAGLRSISASASSPSFGLLHSNIVVRNHDHPSVRMLCWSTVPKCLTTSSLNRCRKSHTSNKRQIIWLFVCVQI